MGEGIFRGVCGIGPDRSAELKEKRGSWENVGAWRMTEKTSVGKSDSRGGAGTDDSRGRSRGGRNLVGSVTEITSGRIHRQEPVGRNRLRGAKTTHERVQKKGKRR